MADDENKDTETPEIRDPMSLRDTDTSRLKRIKPQTSLRVANVDGSTEVGSETVHLKVIKEKKKQLAGILSASQTIRLRPSGSEATGPAPANEAPKPGTLKLKAPSPTSPETSKVTRSHRSPDELVAGDNKRPTLKLKAPGTGDAVQSAPAGGDPTIKVSPPTTAAAAAGGAGSGRATLKLKAPGEKKLKTHSLPRPGRDNQETVKAPATGQAEVETSALSKSTLKLRAPSGGAAPTQQAPASGGTLKLRAPGSDSGGSGSPGTLKLRAPGSPGTGESGGGAGKATLKLRAPTSPGGGDEKKPGTLKLKAPESAETVRQEAPKPGKTLKLRSTPSTGSAEPEAAPAEAPQTQAAPELYAAPPAAHPGVLYTLGAVASLILAGVVCYMTITQYLDLFQIK